MVLQFLKCLTILLFLTLLVSCKENHGENKKFPQEEVELKNMLMKKYSTQYIWGWEFLEEKEFSIEFNDIVNSDLQLMKDFEIQDIYNRNNKLYLLLSVDLNYLFELEVMKDQLSKIIEVSAYSSYEQTSYLIVNVEKIRKFPISLAADIDFLEEDTYAYLDFVPSDYFYGTGYLISVENIE